MTTDTFINSALEYKVLAGFQYPENYDRVLQVTKHLFTNERQGLFKAAQQALEQYKVIDYESLTACYGKPIPNEMDVPVLRNLDSAIDELVRIAIKRQVRDKAQELEAVSKEHDISLATVHDILTFAPILVTQDSSIMTGTSRFLSDLHKKQSGEYKFISTGYKFLDTMLAGEWTRRAITVIKAAPGTGKTALFLCSMTRMGRNGIASGALSLEMTRDRLVARMVSDIAEIDGYFIKKGALSREELLKAEQAAQYIDTLPLSIVDKRRMHIDEIVYHVKELIKKGCRVIFIDHLQQIRTNSKDRNSDLGDVTERLAELAMYYDVAIVILSQKTPSKEGVYSIRDSGEVGAIAEVVIDLEPNVSDDDDVKYIKITFEKNRDGVIGSQKIRFNGGIQRFIDIEDGVKDG